MKTRFAPSPTGFLHLGSVRTALFAWLLARNNGGQFYLRIEDTDMVRSKSEYTDLILNTMEWLGLDWDGSIEYQSRRYDRYNQVVDDLVAQGKAYYCSCSPERLTALREQQKEQGDSHSHYDGACRDKNYGPAPGNAVRLKIPLDANLSFVDQLHGQQDRDRNTVDDWIIKRSDGNPTYNFAVVIDDYDMEITHVIRGDDHLNNTPKQVAMYQIMGWDVPLFFHIPMILDESGGRLSKRSGSANILQYREQGFLPGALLNALVRLGWSHGDQEIFTVEEMIALFDGNSLQRSAASFNPEKFHWLAKQWMISTPIERLAEFAITEGFIKDDSLAITALALVQKRVKNMSEIGPMIDFLYNAPAVTMDDLLADYSQDDLHHLKTFIAQLQGKLDTDPDNFFSLLKQYCKLEGIAVKNLAFPLRHILTGSPQSPDLGEVIKALSLDEVYARIAKVLSNT